MADFQLDKKQNRSAAGLGGAQGATSGALAGASIGAAAGGAAGGIGAIPGALIGAAIGAAAIGASGAGIASAQDKRAQKDAYEVEQAQASAQKKAEIDQSAAARAATTATVSPSMQYMGLSKGGSAYDSWRSSVYGG